MIRVSDISRELLSIERIGGTETRVTKRRASAHFIVLCDGDKRAAVEQADCDVVSRIRLNRTEQLLRREVINFECPDGVRLLSNP
jgi:CRISPR/Cas system-associated protein Cas5 (RAMP superfamily)